MKALKIVTVFLAIVLAGFLVLGFTGPKDFHVKRSVEIDAPPAVVYDYVNSLEDMDVWSPWMQLDPNMTKNYTGTPGEVGSKLSWSGNDDVGVGSQEITALQPKKRVETHLIFEKPYESESEAYIDLQATGNGKTTATWGLTGNNGFIERILFTFMDIDDAVGKDYEKGLASLKELVESRPKVDPMRPTVEGGFQ